MIQITPQMRILVATEPVDFRKGIDGLCATCRQIFVKDPFQGYVFVFRNQRRTALKLLMYDGQGFWLCQKRLSSGRYCWWPTPQDDGLCSLAVHELHLLLWNGSPEQARVAPIWRSVNPAALG
jgi:transposase